MAGYYNPDGTLTQAGLDYMLPAVAAERAREEDLAALQKRTSAALSQWGWAEPPDGPLPVANKYPPALEYLRQRDAEDAARRMQRQSTPVETDPAKIAAQQQPMPEPQGGAGMTYDPTRLVETSRQTVTQSAALGPAQAREAKAALAAADERGIADAASKADELGQLSSQMADVQAAWAAEAKRAEAESGDRALVLGSTAERLGAELEDARKRLDGASYVPLSTFSNTAIALLGVTAAIEGFTAQRFGRPSRAAEMISGAIDRDLQQQRENYQRQLASMQMTAAERDKAIARQERALAEQRQYARDAVTMDLAALGARKDGVLQKWSAAETALQIQRQGIGERVKLDMASRPKSTTAVTQQPIGAMAQAQQKLDPVMARKYASDRQQYQAAIKTIDETIRDVESGSNLQLRGMRVPNEVGTRINNNLKDLALAHRKAMGDTGPIRGDDFQAYDRLSTQGWGKLFDSREALLNRLRKNRDDIVGAMRRGAEALTTPVQDQIQSDLALRTGGEREAALGITR